MKGVFIRIRSFYFRNAERLEANIVTTDWRNVLLISITFAAFILVFTGMSIVDNDGSLLIASALELVGGGWIATFCYANR